MTHPTLREVLTRVLADVDDNMEFAGTVFKSKDHAAKSVSKSLEIIWKRINRHGRYYDKPMKYTEFAAAIDNLIRKERSQAIASYKKVLAEEARLKGGIDD